MLNLERYIYAFVINVQMITIMQRYTTYDVIQKTYNLL